MTIIATTTKTIIGTDEMAGCCSRLFAAECDMYAFEHTRQGHRRELSKDKGYISWLERMEGRDGAAFITYWTQLVRLCGSHRKAYQVYISYINLLGEKGV